MLAQAEVSVWLEDRCQRHVSEHEVRLFLFDQTWCVFSIVVGDHFVGVAGLADPSVREDVARFFIVVGDSAMWGQGLGSGVTQEVVRFGFETLGLRKIVSDYLDGNEGSKRVHERAGFQIEGVRRQDAWRNGGWVNRVVLSVLQTEAISVI